MSVTISGGKSVSFFYVYIGVSIRLRFKVGLLTVTRVRTDLCDEDRPRWERGFRREECPELRLSLGLGRFDRFRKKR